MIGINITGMNPESLEEKAVFEKWKLSHKIYFTENGFYQPILVIEIENKGDYIFEVDKELHFNIPSPKDISIVKIIVPKTPKTTCRLRVIDNDNFWYEIRMERYPITVNDDNSVCYYKILDNRLTVKTISLQIKQQ